MPQKKQKPVFKLIKLHYFPFDILYTKGTTEKQIAEYIKNNFTFELDEEEKASLQVSGKSGRTVQFKNKAVLMWLKGDSMGTLAHEALHAVTFVLESVGIRYSNETDEVYAYGVEYVINQINNK